MDTLALLATVLPVAVLAALLCATLVCLAAILRAHRDDVVAVLLALPAVVAAMLRRKR
ncbi:hypothetical protein ABZ684_04695 [Streptomyces sp. NPDC006995]|uniref:hypothetical protein n=1 Tax=Streptomyces sp. NPDC006995 TaxID=3156907 RepID=UPI0033D39E2A